MKKSLFRTCTCVTLLAAGLMAPLSCGSSGSSGLTSDAAGGSNPNGSAGSGGQSGSGLQLVGAAGSTSGSAGSSANPGSAGSGCGDNQTDPDNCGACGNVCGTGQSCVAGACVCPSYQSLCGGACIPTSVDPKNCGGCGVTCTGTQACSGGVCASGCLPGLTVCDNTCVDLQNDSANCGACSTPCADGKGCANGNCVNVVPVGPAPKKCVGGGAPISIGSGPRDCLGTLAQTTFQWSLCSCTDLDVSAPLTTDAYDSSKGPYKPGELGGGVGVDRDVTHWSQAVAVGGTLWVAGSNAYQSSGPPSTVKADMHLGGSWKASSAFAVDGAAYVVGTLSGVTVQGATSAVKSVPAACDCSASQLVPVAAIVAAHRAPNNDNAAINLDATVFESPGAPLRLDLPCGNYYLTSILTSQALTIYAHGRTALYIDGDVIPSSPLAFALDPDGELDVFIAGTIKSSQTLVIGSPNYPALSRTYVGGTAQLSFSQDVRLAGEFYAANSQLVDWSASNEIYGSVFAGNFKSSQVTDIHYDRAVLRAGDECPPGGAGGMSGAGGSSNSGGGNAGGTTGCGSCADCHNQACNNGVCGACTTDADCCAPLVCAGGTCIAQVVK